MSLIKCPNCGYTVSDKAEKCPNCGSPIKSMRNNVRKVSNSQSSVGQNSHYAPHYVEENSNQYAWIWILLVIFIIGGFVWYGVSKNHKSSNSRAYTDSMAVDPAAVASDSTAATTNQESQQQTEEQKKIEESQNQISRLRGRYRMFQRNPDGPGTITISIFTINNDNSLDLESDDVHVHKNSGFIDGDILYFGNDGDDFDSTIKFRIKMGMIYPFDEERGEMGATIFINKE